MIELGVILAALIAISASLFVALMMIHAFRYVPFVPTENKVVEKMIEIAELKKGEKIYDLGCGDGRILEVAMSKAPVEAIGIEISYIVISLARLRSWWKGSSIKLIRKNFYNQDLSDADIVICYLFPGVMKKLQKKFEKELKPGARVISYSFPMIEWQPSKTLITKEKKPKNFLVYRYDIPDAYRSSTD
jgi:SAM-dependent methyltransferase